MSSSRVSLVRRLNDATSQARTRTGDVVTILHEERGGMLVTSCAFHGARGEIDVEESATPFWPDDVPEARLDAFLRGLRSAVATFERRWVAAGDFLPFALLEARSLATAGDFARAIVDPTRQRLAHAEIFAEDLGSRRALPPIDGEDAVRLFRLDMLDGTESELLAVVDEVGRSPLLRRHAFALLELWADRGLSGAVGEGVAMARRGRQLATRLACLLERRAETPFEREWLSRIGTRLDDRVVAPADLAAAFSAM